MNVFGKNALIIAGCGVGGFLISAPMVFFGYGNFLSGPVGGLLAGVMLVFLIPWMTKEGG